MLNTFVIKKFYESVNNEIDVFFHIYPYNSEITFYVKKNSENFQNVAC